MTDVLDELQWRGLIAQHTDLDALRAALADGPVSYYCGFDPTAPSLHHGHLVQLLLLRHLQNAGHHPYALVGGATGMIGDPRMSGERKLNTAETVAEWTERLRGQVSRFLSFEGDNAATVVNNLDWTAGLTAIELLRDVGQHFRISAMLAKDTVATRLASSEGLSYTEFSYQLLQGMDFLELYRRHDVTLQTGGNDQWGNLVSGLDLIRKVEGTSVHVLTTPLITKADGTKFGKTEGGAVWLAPDMMSPYAFYQFWLNTADDDVVRFLKIFTFRTREEIEALAAEVADRPFARAAQRTLAEDVTTLVHGADATARVQAASAAVFGKGDLRDLDADTLRDATAELPRATGVVGETSIVDLLVATGLEAGRGAARRTIASGGASVNGHKIDDDERLLAAGDLLAGGVVVLRRGKKNMAIVETHQG
ncbi:tyrosine--tRNA ligase [Georgenia sp. Z1491]|uniref:tyrosine--tRNA ligase n=1 Tax=Georgenia sp. Z1491 TaxID=3416707 RepID=UPI003CF0B945